MTTKTFKSRGCYTNRTERKTIYLRNMYKMTKARAPALAAATKQRGQLAAAQANLAEFKSAKIRGELVEAAAVEAEWVSLLRAVRARMLAVPSRPAHRFSRDVAFISGLMARRR